MSNDQQKCPYHTTTAGAPIADNQNSLTAGPRGPLLVQDWQLDHWDRWRPGDWLARCRRFAKSPESPASLRKWRELRRRSEVLSWRISCNRKFAKSCKKYRSPALTQVKAGA